VYARTRLANRQALYLTRETCRGRRRLSRFRRDAEFGLGRQMGREKETRITASSPLMELALPPGVIFGANFSPLGAFPHESIAAPQLHRAKPVHLEARSSADREYRRCRCAEIFLRTKQEKDARERERERRGWRKGEKGSLSVPRYCDRVAAACAWSV